MLLALILITELFRIRPVIYLHASVFKQFLSYFMLWKYITLKDIWLPMQNQLISPYFSQNMIIYLQPISFYCFCCAYRRGYHWWGLKFQYTLSVSDAVQCISHAKFPNVVEILENSWEMFSFSADQSLTNCSRTIFL